MNLRKVFKWSAAIAIIGIIISAVITGYGYYLVKLKKVQLEETAYIYITHEDNATTVMQKIKNAAGNASTTGFKLLAKHNNFDKRKRSGKFAIKDGVYSGIVKVYGKAYKSIINYGARPTFDLDKKLVEAHLIGFDGDLYGKKIEDIQGIGRFGKDIREHRPCCACVEE